MAIAYFIEISRSNKFLKKTHTQFNSLDSARKMVNKLKKIDAPFVLYRVFTNDGNTEILESFNQ